MSEETTLTMSVPAAGKKYFGLAPRPAAALSRAGRDLPLAPAARGTMTRPTPHLPPGSAPADTPGDERRPRW